MPYTGGIFALLASYKATTRTPIPSASHNAVLEDLQTAQNFPRPVPAGGTGANTPDGAAKALALISNKILAGVSAVSGSADEITIDTAQNFDALTNLVVVAFRPTATSVSGGTTVALDGLAAKAVRKIVATGDVDINSGDMRAKGIYTLVYDPTADSGDGAFILVNPEITGVEQVGDYLGTLRNPGGNYLKRDGSLYLKTAYPELAIVVEAAFGPLPDGLDWSVKTSGTASTLEYVFEGNGKFVASGGNGTILVSTDRQNWFPKSSGLTTQLHKGCYGSGVYLITEDNGKVLKSGDAEAWSSTAVGASRFYTSVIYAGGQFVLCGGTISGNQPRIYTSTDAASWTEQTAGLSGVTSFATGIAYNGSTYVVTLQNGNVLTSTDGITWVQRTTGSAQALNDIAYGNGLFVAVGNGGVIYTSANGIAWTARTSGTTSALRGITYSTSGWLACGDGGVVRISAAGTSWAGSATPVSASLYSATPDAAAPEQYVLTGANGTILNGIRTLPTQFRVPNDGANQWIRAVP